MVVTPTLSRINHTIRRTVNYLKYAPWRFARFTIRSRFRAFIVSARRIKSSSDSKSLSFFDTSIRINLDLIKTHACERLIGYQFKEPLLLWEALQPAGPLDGMPQMPRYEDGNKRLAIVGDRVLALLLALKWYPSWGMRMAYGTLHTDILSNKSLEQMGTLNQLDRYITLPARYPDFTEKMMATTVEAIIGAAYLDGQLGAAKTVTQNLGFDVLDGLPQASEDDQVQESTKRLLKGSGLAIFEKVKRAYHSHAFGQGLLIDTTVFLRQVSSTRRVCGFKPTLALSVIPSMLCIGSPEPTVLSSNKRTVLTFGAFGPLTLFEHETIFEHLPAVSGCVVTAGIKPEIGM